MVYDFILGKTLTDNYIRLVYMNRLDISESKLSTIAQLARFTHKELVSAWSNVDKLPYQVSLVMDSLNDLVGRLDEGDITGIDEDNAYYKYRQILSTLSSLDYEVYIISRPELKTTDVTPGNRAYLIDRNDSLFPSLNRVATGNGINFKDPAEASLPNVIMTFLESYITLDPVTKSVLELNAMIEQYKTLASANMGWKFDIKPLQKFLLDYGYKFIVVME